MESTQFDLTSLTADIVSAYVAHNALTGEKIPELISSVYGALSRASRQAVEPEPVELKPAVAIKKSVTPEYIICLEDGQKFKSLKRHLKTHYDMSPEEYREKWGLPRDYPMVAPSYAAARSDLAKNMGLGRRGGAVVAAEPEAPTPVAVEKPKGRGKQTRIASNGSPK
ncbi:MAG TPA: MucR family transcriptional regulator [Terriglobales bacterium]|nr:MucR family transcriptional regulator [Terriglobales bacterium]